MKPTQTAERQPISRAAGTREGGMGAGAVLGDTSLVCYDVSLAGVSMETCRTLSNTWPGAGRNPETQISA